MSRRLSIQCLSLAAFNVLLMSSAIGRCDAAPLRVGMQSSDVTQENAKSNEAEASYKAAQKKVNEDGDPAGAIRLLQQSFEQGLKTPSKTLSDPAFQSIRKDPTRRAKLRELLAAHARESKVEMVTADEKGNRVKFEFDFVDKDSDKPLANTRVYLYHTDAEGDYAPEAETAGGGSDNPRLFAYVRTDAKGHASIASILPNSYRGTDVPRHIHFVIDREKSSAYGTGLYFDGDPPLDNELREEAETGRVTIASIKSGDAEQTVAVTFRVPKDS